MVGPVAVDDDMDSMIVLRASHQQFSSAIPGSIVGDEDVIDPLAQEVVQDCPQDVAFVMAQMAPWPRGCLGKAGTSRLRMTSH